MGAGGVPGSPPVGFGFGSGSGPGSMLIAEDARPSDSGFCLSPAGAPHPDVIATSNHSADRSIFRIAPPPVRGRLVQRPFHRARSVARASAPCGCGLTGWLEPTGVGTVQRE